MNNLQTMAFITLIDSLFIKQRSNSLLDSILLDSEIQLLTDYIEISHLINNYTYEWISDVDVSERNNQKKSLDVSFHKAYQKLHNSFKVVRDSYMQFCPGIENLYVNAVPSVANLIDLYSQRVFKLEHAL